MNNKVLIISDYKSGGAGKVASISGELLEKNGYQVFYYWGNEHFIFSPLNYIFNSKANDSIKNKIEGIKPNFIILHNYDNLLSPLILKSIKDYKSKSSCRIIMTCHDYHIVSASNSLTFFKGGKKSFFKKIPSFIELISVRLDERSYVHGLARIIQWYLYYKLLKLHDVIDSFTCPSVFIKTKVKQRLSNEDVVFLHNPPTLNPISYRLAKNNYKIKIAFVGRVSDDKGIYEFINSFYKFAGQSSILNQIEFLIIGKGPNYEKLKELSETEDKKVNINLLGYLNSNEIKEVLTGSSYILLPSIVYENAPLSLIEGVFCQCDIITMNYGGMKEIADKISSSIKINDFSERSIKYLLSEILEQRKMTKNEFDKFANTYSVNGYLEGLKKLL